MIKEKTNINAQIKLLDDPDNAIFNIVRESLLDCGHEIIPELEKAWESSINLLVQERIETIIQCIHTRSLCREFSRWVQSDEKNLIEGAYLIAKHQYPELIYKDIYLKVETITNDIWLELNSGLTTLEKTRIINKIIFNEYKFNSNEKNIYSSRNCYINNLLETKNGNPLSMLILYAGIAQNLGLPVYFVNLPFNFILAYKDEFTSVEAFGKGIDSPVLFYINPHDKGEIFSKREIDYYLKKAELNPVDSYYLPADNLLLVEFMINHLIFIYDKSGYTDKVNELKELLAICNNEV